MGSASCGCLFRTECEVSYALFTIITAGCEAVYIYSCFTHAFSLCFLVIYSGQLGNAGAEDVAEALWLGARISLKTTAFLVGFPFVFGTIPYALWKNGRPAVSEKSLAVWPSD